MESINKIGGLLLWSDTNAWGNSGALLWFRTTPGRRWGRHGETEWERKDLRGSNLGAICAHCVSQISSRNKVWRQILLAAFNSFLYKMFVSIHASPQDAAVVVSSYSDIVMMGMRNPVSRDRLCAEWKDTKWTCYVSAVHATWLHKYPEAHTEEP